MTQKVYLLKKAIFIYQKEVFFVMLSPSEEVEWFSAESFEAEDFGADGDDEADRGNIYLKTFTEETRNREDGKKRSRTWISGYFSSYDAAMKDAKKEEATYSNYGSVYLYDKRRGMIIVDAVSDQRSLFTKIIYQSYRELGDNPGELYRTESFGADDEKVTERDTEFWLGSSNTVSEAVEVITSVANGEYKPKNLKEDILDHKKDFELYGAETFHAEIPKSVKMGFGFATGLALFQVAVIAGAIGIGMLMKKDE